MIDNCVKGDLTMLFSNQIVIYGTGGAAKKFIEQNKQYIDKISVVVGKNVEVGGVFRKHRDKRR